MQVTYDVPCARMSAREPQHSLHNTCMFTCIHGHCRRVSACIIQICLCCQHDDRRVWACAVSLFLQFSLFSRYSFWLFGNYDFRPVWGLLLCSTPGCRSACHAPLQGGAEGMFSGHSRTPSLCRARLRLRKPAHISILDIARTISLQVHANSAGLLQFAVPEAISVLI